MTRSLFGKSAILALFMALFLIAAAHAMEKTDDIDTNRPSFMDSPLVLPRASVQLENGELFQWFHHGNQWQFDIPETELRVGLSKNTELQLFIPNYNLVRSNIVVSQPNDVTSPVLTYGDTLSHVSDITEIGIKEQLGPILANAKNVPGFLRNYNLAVIVGVTPPTGSSFISGTGTGGTLRFPWSKSIGKNYCIAGMQSLLLLNSGTELQYQPDVLFGRNIGPRGFIFAEYGGFLTEGHGIANIAHFGGVRKLTRHQQVDIQFGFGMDDRAPIALVGVGYSLRFDKFKW
jgi:hypothetical protein